VARIELCAELRAIEALIDDGDKEEASSQLLAVQATLGRRPEYRYLCCLFDTTFQVRPDRELVREAMDLVGEQPDLMEAMALLALLYARTGDDSRADLFARLALEASNPAARARAVRVLEAKGKEAEPHVSRTPSRPEPGAGPRRSSPGAMAHVSVGRGAAAGAQPAVDPSAELSRWFQQAKRDLVHRRSPTYGVRSIEFVVELLLDWGKAVAEGKTPLSSEPMPLTRASLAKIDETMVSLRRAHGTGSASKSDTSLTSASAGFFLAVVLHELEANALEIAPNDGGCKVIVPSGAGARPLLVASAFAEGTGQGFVQTFDRLATAVDLAASRSHASSVPAAPRSGPHVSRTPSQQRAMVEGLLRPSTSRMHVVKTPTFPPGSAPPVSLAGEELAFTRPEVEAVPVRLLARPPRAGDPPPINLPIVAAALTDSQLGREIAERTGMALAPNPAGIEALESYCQATRGETGVKRGQAVWQPSDVDEEIILAWGAFLGEALIATYGGVWECDPNAPSDPRLFRVVCQDRVAAWPITQVYLRLKNGAPHDLIEFVAAVGRLLG
jgi:hypothetical protein